MRIINESVISTVPEPLPKEGPVSGKDKEALATAGIEIMDIKREPQKKDPYHEVIE
jgi:hypothetical protein